MNSVAVQAASCDLTAQKERLMLTLNSSTKPMKTMLHTVTYHWVITRCIFISILRGICSILGCIDVIRAEKIVYVGGFFIWLKQNGSQIQMTTTSSQFVLIVLQSRL